MTNLRMTLTCHKTITMTDLLLCIHCGNEMEVRTESVSSPIGYMVDRVAYCDGCGYKEEVHKEIKVNR